MTHEHRLYTYFKENYVLITIFVFFAISMVSSATIIPGLLAKNHHIHESIISIGGLAFAISYALGTAFGKEFVKYRFNYFLFIRVGFLILTLMWIFLYYICEFNIIDVYQFIYPILRLIEGFIGALILFIVNNFFSLRLIDHKKNMEILGIQSTLYFLTKTSIPVFFAGVILYFGQNIIFILSALITFFIYITFYSKKKLFLNKYYRHMLKTLNKNLNSIKIKDIKLKHLLPNIKIFEINKIKKYRIYSILFLQNSLRVFYDLLYFVILTKEFEVSFVKAGIIIAAMSIGQAFQYPIAILIRRLKKINISDKLINFFGQLPLIITLLILIYMFFEHIKMDSFYFFLLLFLAFFVGVGRAFFSAFSDYYNFKFINSEKEFISDFNGSRSFFGDVGNIFGYILSSLFLLIGFKSILIALIVVNIIIIAISL